MKIKFFFERKIPKGLRYYKVSDDLPSDYCCDDMEAAVEEIRFVPYEKRPRKYSFSSPNNNIGSLGPLYYCPFCGENQAPLELRHYDKVTEYVVKGDLSSNNFYDYWHLISKNLDNETTTQLISQEKEKSRIGEYKHDEHDE